MAGRKSASRPSVPLPPRVYRAQRKSLGRVVPLQEITEADAVLEYQAGGDIVVCGENGRANRTVGQRIANAVGPNRRHDPHESQGPYALPHFQPLRRPPDGHVFYETAGKKAAKKP